MNVAVVTIKMLCHPYNLALPLSIAIFWLALTCVCLVMHIVRSVRDLETGLDPMVVKYVCVLLEAQCASLGVTANQVSLKVAWNVLIKVVTTSVTYDNVVHPF